MSQPYARLWDKWVAAGDGMTFEEWRASRRAHTQQQRWQRRFSVAAFTATPQYMSRYPNLMQALIDGNDCRQQQRQVGLLHGLSGVLGGLL